MRSRNFLQSLLMIALITHFGGCVAVDRNKYPESWSSLNSGLSHCEAIVGIYENTGQRDKRSSSYPVSRLSVALLGQAGPKEGEYVQIEMHASQPELLSVTVYSGKEIAGSGNIQAKCSEEGVLISEPGASGFVNEGGVIAYGRETRKLLSAQDGSLILYSSGTGAGLMLLVPFVASERQWARYMRMSNGT